MKRSLMILAALLAAFSAGAQEQAVKFAYMSDIHLCEGSPKIHNLELCIEDINNQPDIKFAMFGGDITEFGADNEIALAKAVIDKLKVPYYIVAGNHDAKWSESGCNTFKKVFGYEQFEFEAGGVKFLGSNCGPNMRMAPALLPHESLVWLDSIAKATPPEKPVIFVNHFPQDTSILNYFQVMNTLKQCNVQMLIGGHWHQNRVLDYEGVPGILGRSPDKGKEIGYNIMEVSPKGFKVHERVLVDKDGNSNVSDGQTWFSMEFSDKPKYTPDTTSGNAYGLPKAYPFVNFSINDKYSQVKEIWRHQDEGDVGDGAVTDGRTVVYANTSGTVKALDLKTGKQLWAFTTDGKVFSTPAIAKGKVVIGSTDNNIYCLNLKNGSLVWKYECDKSVLATPVVQNGIVYCGSSDHVFRALKLKNGSLVWKYTGVKGFVECKPFIDKDQIVFGDWANTLYSLNPEDGSLQWQWTTKGSRMYSPAAVYPVKADGKIFIVTPERKTYALDAKTGKQLWSAPGGRESIALNCDGSRIYVKNMYGRMHAFSTKGDQANEIWNVPIEGQGYEIAPTSCACDMVDGREVVFMPTDKGNVFCLDAKDASIIWIHKVSVALINSIVTLPGRQLLVCTMDGVVTRLAY